MSYKDFEERISSQQGTYIVAGSKEFETIVDKIPLCLAGDIIKCGDETIIAGWFFKPCRYIGMLGNQAIFYLGQGKSDLFSHGAEYYDVTYILGENHIGKSYSPGTFRDVYFKKGKWK